MLSAADNRRITRTGRDTPMGKAMRRYWIPALLSSELRGPDSGPLRVMLLGERLVAFRETSGRVGMIAEECPHRGASLFFGRNEAGGLRCVYHGRKFSVDGVCLEFPDQAERADDVRAVAYPCIEMGGVVWVWMGPPREQPPLQTQEWMRVPDSNRDVCRHLGDCNWLQLLEGGIDTAHSSFLHRAFNRGPDSEAATLQFRARAIAPRLEVVRTEYGYSYAGIRHLPERQQNYVRAYQFVMPFHQMRAFEGYLGHRLVSGHMWVPVDDEHTWVWSWTHTAEGETLPPEVIDVERRQAGRTAGDVIPGTLRFRRNRANDYLIDRQRQKTVNYTGIQTLAAQDQAIQESLGPIADRSTEHLGRTDVAIIATRRLLSEACDEVERGRPPLGSRLEHITARPAEMLLPADLPWLEAMREHLVAPA
jgi:nitrite reductase/ring-hydroxylating ferredoxin subunit